MARIRYLIGLVTLAAVLAGAWLLVAFLDRDEMEGKVPFTIEFADARGLRPGAYVRCRGVVVGTVREVDLVPGGNRARARILVEEGLASTARATTVFWVVSPRFGGITDGASGLDTLVRDSYIAFFTPGDDAGPPLAPGSTVLGRENPPDLSGEDTLIPPRHGDLLMELLVPSNHGLEPGSRVAFRGVTTGEVRRVRLAKSGTHVEVSLRIDREFRHTITDRSRFWIARPNLSVELIEGVSVEDLDALLATYVAYYTEPGVGVPVTDGYRAAASAERPDIVLSPVPGDELVNPRPTAVENDTLRMVRVVYLATEEDPFSNDEIRRESSGLLVVTRSGQVAVITARSACDAAWFDRDAFDGDPEIVREEIKVVLPSGPVLAATRVWTDDRADLAVLVLHDAAQDLPATADEHLDFESGIPEDVQIVAADPKGAPLEAERAGARELPAVADHRGALLLDEKTGRVVGILGQSTPTGTEAAGLVLSRVPEIYRPGS